MNRLPVPEKLAVNKYELDEGHPHIVVNEEVCRAKCKNLACLYVCPANVYSEQNGKIMADWAGCLECGTCLVTCPSDALQWVYPRGGFGVIYRSG
ncbi:MAG: 4Fe-4S dicluster domain-containing protein [Bellilinea sp.]